MEKAVYINSVSAYLPNSPIDNEEMEDYIGKIGGNPSRVRSIVLRQNGIRTRYYGLDKNQNLTHSNAGLAKEAVCGLFENRIIPDDLTLLACGTSTPDQLLPNELNVHNKFRLSLPDIASPCMYNSADAYAITPDGEIYKCIEHVGNKSRSIGNIVQESISLGKLSSCFFKNNHLENSDCIDCPVLPVCGGGCPLDREVDKDANKMSCSFYKTHLDKILSNIKL